MKRLWLNDESYVMQSHIQFHYKLIHFINLKLQLCTYLTFEDMAFNPKNIIIINNHGELNHYSNNRVTPSQSVILSCVSLTIPHNSFEQFLINNKIKLSYFQNSKFSYIPSWIIDTRHFRGSPKNTSILFMRKSNIRYL